MSEDRSEIRRRVNRGLSWVGLASTLVTLLDAIAIFLILKFWVTQEQYGIATAAWWLFPILDLATDLGLSAAVIQRDDHTEHKISTVFWLNLMMGIGLAALLFAAGPLIRWWSGEAVVASMIAVYGLKLIWQSVYTIPQALMRREFRYRELSTIRLTANLVEFGLKIGSAAAGAGVWFIVIGPLGRFLVTGIGTQICHPWRPRWVFKLRDAVDYTVFGVKASASQILFYTYSNIDYPIVKQFFGFEALGMYRAAYEIILEPVKVISDVIREVAFPAFSRLRHEPARLVEQFVAFTRMNLVTTTVYLAVAFIAAEEILLVFVKPEYLPGAPIIRVLFAVGILRAMGFVAPPLLDAMGFPGRTLAYQAVAAAVLPALFIASASVFRSLGPLSVAIAWAVGYPIAFAVLSMMALGLLPLTARDYVRRVRGIPVWAAVALACGAVAKWGLAGARPGVSLIFVALVTASVFAALLARFERITPRSIAAAMKGQPPPPPPA
jgi:O-antigen/teichoic acid export membrane protein